MYVTKQTPKRTDSNRQAGASGGSQDQDASRQKARAVIADKLVAWFSTDGPPMARIEAEALAEEVLDALEAPSGAGRE